eukprot:CAMPEP_0178413876 /NCGR_PEP_ID=MMETSP0689_2-20121128/22751_1 /TAXON_ID=160604 /ORGANISM="Amphidinium massartii, Strain CS-259" /LENGTH=219 /DNA_ID=CAMNT_0020035157 /DNA_START=119 /DNA_END=778 /DNA_ORIENTATION=+
MAAHTGCNSGDELSPRPEPREPRRSIRRVSGVMPCCARNATARLSTSPSQSRPEQAATNIPAARARKVSPATRQLSPATRHMSPAASPKVKEAPASQGIAAPFRSPMPGRRSLGHLQAGSLQLPAGGAVKATHRRGKDVDASCSMSVCSTAEPSTVSADTAEETESLSSPRLIASRRAALSQARGRQKQHARAEVRTAVFNEMMQTKLEHLCQGLVVRQ